MLRKARSNISGLVKMNDDLADGNAQAAKAIKVTLKEIGEPKERCSEPDILGMKLVAEQRDHLLRWESRLRSEFKTLTKS